MAAKNKTQNFDNADSGQKGLFEGSWGWGFGFGWLAFFFAIVAMFIGKNTAFVVALCITFYLIFVNIFRLTFISNNAYGWSAFLAMIIGIIDLILTFIFRKGL